MDDVLKQNVITQNITLAVGNTLIVKLGSNYTTPYRWTPDTKIGDPAIIKQISHEFVQPTSDALGAPGTEVWTFTALKPGTTTITTSYTSFVGKDTETDVHVHGQRDGAVNLGGARRGDSATVWGVFGFLRNWSEIGNLPAELRDQLEAEGLIFSAGKVGVSRHFSGHVPGRLFGLGRLPLYGRVRLQHRADRRHLPDPWGHQPAVHRLPLGHQQGAGGSDHHE